MSARSHRDLEVWKVAMDLVLRCYALAATLPRHETFGLGSQLRRAAVSIPSNVAEGYGRIHRKEYVHHLSFALGSVRELTTLLEIVHRLEYADSNALRPAARGADRVGRMLHGLITSLRGDRRRGSSDGVGPNPDPRTPSPHS